MAPRTFGTMAIRWPLSRPIAFFALVLTAIAVTGCSHALGRPMPPVKGPLAVKVSHEPAVRFGEMPIFVHQIPDSSVYVSGHEGAASIGGLFGIVGVAVAVTAARAVGESRVRDYQAQLRVDLHALTERLFAEELTRPQHRSRFAPASPPGDVLEISPFLVVNYVGTERVRLWVVLKTVLKDARGDQKWKTKYAAGVGEIRPLGGADGWASDDGAPLRKAIDRNLRLAMDAFLRDVSGELPRGRGRMVNVRAQWVWMRLPSDEIVEVLDETQEALVVIPQVVDTFFAGVSILDKRWLTITSDVK